MSDRIDVLAGMDDVIEHAMHKPERNCGTLAGLRLEEARAAVAELIEAMTAERRARDTSAPVAVLAAAIERTDAALAQVQP